MNNNFKLQTLLDLSQARMEDAARQLGQLLSSEQEGAKKLAMLTQYRDEYQRGFLEAAKQGLAQAQWANYQAFLTRLNQAVAQQQSALDHSKQRTSDGQMAWLEQRNKTKAFDTLSQRHRSESLKAEARAEQKFTDEHAAKGNRDGGPDDDPAA